MYYAAYLVACKYFRPVIMEACVVQTVAPTQAPELLYTCGILLKFTPYDIESWTRRVRAERSSTLRGFYIEMDKTYRCHLL